MRHSIKFLGSSLSSFSLSLSAVSVLGLLLGTPACSGFGSDDDDDAAPIAAPGQRPEQSAPPPLTGTPKDDEVTEQYGVFVVPSGAMEATGTRQLPFGSIVSAVARAKATSKRVYVCEGTFKEAVTIERGISIVGGFDCSSFVWRKTDRRTRIESPSSPALRATDINIATRFEGFDVYAPDGTSESTTSMGLHAKNSPALTISGSKIEAGRGHNGAAGTEAAQLANDITADGGKSKPETSGPANPLLPPPSVGHSGGFGGVNMCAGHGGDVSSGGRGGSGGLYRCEQIGPYPPYMWIPRDVSTSGEARTGAAGVPGMDGPSAATFGSLTPEGFAAGDGSTGVHGVAGKGGAGGAATVMSNAACPTLYDYGWVATGPGGGAGGCPGLAGTPGKGGGGSIGALIAASAGLVLDATEVIARDGGNGGKGTFGSSPTLGGNAGVVSGTAQVGAPGGKGGRAGVSGSGAGGPSIGIAHTGGEPKMDGNSSAKAGKAGVGVAAESTTDALGNGKALAASADGIVKDVHGF